MTEDKPACTKQNNPRIFPPHAENCECSLGRHPKIHKDFKFDQRLQANCSPQLYDMACTAARLAKMSLGKYLRYAIAKQSMGVLSKNQKNIPEGALKEYENEFGRGM